MKIKHKLIILPIFVILSFYIFILGFLIPKYKSFLYEEKKNQLVSSSFQYTSVINQLIKEKTNIETIKSYIRSARFGEYGLDYALVIDDKANIVVHPFMRSMEGKSGRDIHDTNGLNLGRAFVTASLKNNDHFVPYRWKGKERGSGKEIEENKLAYSVVLDNDWIIVCSIYTTEIEKKMNRIWNISITYLLILTIIFGLVSFLIIKNIIDGLYFMIDKIGHLNTNEADLSKHLEERGRDEFTILSIEFNKFLHKLFSIVSDVKNSNEQLKVQTNLLMDVLSHFSKLLQDGKVATDNIEKTNMLFYEKIKFLFQNVDDITKKLMGVAAATEEMSYTIQSISNSTNDISLRTQNITKKSDIVKSQVLLLIENNNKMNEIVRLVDDIAKKTNLLSLNAKIEASKAKEQGAGFSVLADEIKKMSMDTISAVVLIRELIDNSVKQSETTLVSVQEILDYIEETGDKFRSIGSSIDEYSNAHKEVNKQITYMSEDVNKTRNLSEESENTITEFQKDVDTFSSNVGSLFAIKSDIQKALELFMTIKEKIDKDISKFK